MKPCCCYQLPAAFKASSTHKSLLLLHTALFSAHESLLLLLSTAHKVLLPTGCCK